MPIFLKSTKIHVIAVTFGGDTVLGLTQGLALHLLGTHSTTELYAPPANASRLKCAVEGLDGAGMR